jgi:Putative neutral zinc metallopeptidase
MNLITKEYVLSNISIYNNIRLGGTRMLTGEKFAHFLMEKECFDTFQVKTSKRNSMFRYKKGIPTIYLLKKHMDSSQKAIEVAAHEVGHAIDLVDKEKYSSFTSYFYICLVVNLGAIFISKLFFIPALIFGVICSLVYIRSELKADENKRILISKHLHDALLKYNDSRDLQQFITDVEKKSQMEKYQVYRIGLFAIFFAPLIMILIAYTKGYPLF